LAELLRQDGQWLAATHQIESICSRPAADWRPVNDFAWNVLVDPRSGGDQIDSAGKWARQTVKAMPLVANYWNTLVLAEYRAGKFDAAERALRESMRLSRGGTISDWYFASLIEQALNRPDTAKNWYHRAEARRLQDDPENAELRQFAEMASAAIQPQ
jgi:hypothetical protein